MHSVPVLGLVGGVGSGKSGVARAAQRLVACQSSSNTPELHPKKTHSSKSPHSRNRLILIQGDEAGHEALRQNDVRRKLRERFGETIFDEQGHVVRATLGRLVFGESEDSRKSRNDLEAIVHPEIVRMFQEQIAAARAQDDVRAILLDAAVLLESGWRRLCDVVVFVDASEANRRRRVIENRGWTEEQFRKRESSQWPLDRKREASDEVISNDGPIDDAAWQLLEIIDRYAARGG